MRISDWSSDVCSSDLRPVATAAQNNAPHNAKGMTKPPTPAKRAIAPVTKNPAKAAGQANSSINMPRPSVERSVSAAKRPSATASMKATIPAMKEAGERKSVVEGKRVAVRVDLGGRRTIKKKK